MREVFAQSFESGAEIGAVVCFVRDGEPVVDLWGGHIDRERTREWQRDTLVNTYSTTKGMTAICAHMLLERGLLDLDAPVARYWPEFAAKGKERIPVRWLLSHQAGLAAPRRKITVERALRLASVRRGAGRAGAVVGAGHEARLPRADLRPSGRRAGAARRRARASAASSATTWPRRSAPTSTSASEPELDARTSDLYGELLPPKLPEGAPPLEGPLGDFFRDMRDPSTLTGAAFGNPSLGSGLVNTRAWRAAELPAVNGHGTAQRARAHLRRARARRRAGRRAAARAARRSSARASEQAFGPDAVLGGMPMRFGLGFMLRQDLMPISPNPRAFGHPGAGGSIGMADPDAKVGFGYTMNKMQMGMMGSAGAFGMIQAFYAAL